MRPQIVKKSVLLLMLFCVGVVALAQQRVPPPPAERTPPPQLPIDDNLLGLMLAGIFIGILILFLKKRKVTS